MLGYYLLASIYYDHFLDTKAIAGPWSYNYIATNNWLANFRLNDNGRLAIVGHAMEASVESYI